MFHSRTAASRLLRRATRWQHSSTQPTLNPITPDDIAHFAQFLPQNAILSTLSPTSVPPSEIEQYNTDWMGRYRGHSTTVLRPQTTEQVSKIMKWCHERRIGVVPQGGNTGLVGGSVPLKDELVLSLSNMTKVRSFDPVSGASWTSYSAVLVQMRTFHSHGPGALVADAGCILEALTEYISPHNHIMPLDLGAKGRYN
jgi:FAD/FMN-containing dehydrogenase